MTIEEKYPAFPKIPRLRRTIVITEKIDGTNALVHVSNEGIVRAGSRTRWITPEHDNFGFATWVRDHESELALLGPGLHYGEWWGWAIQRGYGMTVEGCRGERRFSLFNTGRWSNDAVRPACCHVVPVLETSEYGDLAVERCMERLRTGGSVAAPGFMGPEGVVVFHTASRTLAKVLLEGDDRPKGEVAA